MESQDEVKSACPRQINLAVDPVPVVTTALVHTSVNIAERLWAPIRLVEHESPVAKERGWRQQQAQIVDAAVVGLTPIPRMRRIDLCMRHHEASGILRYC